MLLDYTFLGYAVLGIYLSSTLILFTAGYFLIRKAFRIYKSLSPSAKQSRKEGTRDEEVRFSLHPESCNRLAG